MHYLLLLMTLVGAGIFLWYRYEDARALWRRTAWRHRSAPHPFEAYKTPMPAATAVVVLALRSTGDITAEGRTAMVSALSRTFGISEDEAQALVAQALADVRDTTDEQRWTAKMAAILGAHCSPAEQQQVLTLIETLTRSEGVPAPDSLRLIVRRYCDALGLRKPLWV